MDSPFDSWDTTHQTFSSSFNKFNSALTAGLLNPMSPPLADKARSSPTLFEMMASEPGYHPREAAGALMTGNQISNAALSNQNRNPEYREALMQQRLTDILSRENPGNEFNDSITGDVKLTLRAKDGIKISLYVHRKILVEHSRFFEEKLSKRWIKQQRNLMGPFTIEIADCDDIEVYIETLKLMYCQDIRKRLVKTEVPRVLGILKVSTAIGFDAGICACMEYLESVPWAEDEEEKVASMLSELHLEGFGARGVLKRLSLEFTTGVGSGNYNGEVLLKLLQGVIQGQDEKATREMKGLLSKMLRENSSRSSPNDLRKETLYFSCNQCLTSLTRYFREAARGVLDSVNQIAREADNLHWILDIMIDRRIAEDFLESWTSQYEIVHAYSRVPPIHRYAVSGVTAKLFVAIGKGKLISSTQGKCLLLRTWLEPFYEDFKWMKRSDRHAIEDGLSNTILTLPLISQQEFLMSWFHRFLNSGNDCPNIQRGFEVWWKRAFPKRKDDDSERPQLMRILKATIDEDTESYN